MLKIPLTKEQIALLTPLFNAVRKSDGRIAIGAQIWPDGMIVKAFTGDAGRALSEALKGDWNVTHYSAADRIDDQP